MTEKYLPLSLSQILFNCPDSDFSPTPRAFNDLQFDLRQDFTIAKPSPYLTVMMVFANERLIKSDSAKGVRRAVRVSLMDNANGRPHASTIVRVTIRRGDITAQSVAAIPIDYDSLDFRHSHKVIVTDISTGITLGEREIHFFKNFYGSLHASETLRPVYGGVVPNFSILLYKSFNAPSLTYHRVQFNLCPTESEILPPFIPEMEVRIYFPDGSVESRFIHPVPDEDDAYDTIYSVSSPFLLTSSKKGICYAELICLDIAIAGMVFNSDGDDALGTWYASELEILDEYTPDAAAARYRELTPDTGSGITVEEKTPAISDDVFENALEQFISSQIADSDEDSGEECASENDSRHNEDIPAPTREISPLKALDNLTGLSSVKEKLHTYEKLVIFNKMRIERELPSISLPLHAMFCGSPGTGKTTVAKRMGLMLRRAGVLSRGHVVIKERATLLGPYYSNEETNTFNAIEEAQGGILFIDEAYQLYQPDDPRDPGKFVIEALMTALADDSRRDWMLILAGYTDEMKRMFEMNPGLKSRIPDSNIYVFDDFTEAELMDIADNYLRRHDYTLSPDAHAALSQRLAADYSARDKNFGNARHVINMIQTEILPKMAVRVVSQSVITPESLSEIQACDIPAPVKTISPTRPLIGFRA